MFFFREGGGRGRVGVSDGESWIKCSFPSLLELSPAGVFRLPKIHDIMATAGSCFCVLDFEKRER